MKKEYKTLLIDIDDTILDFQRSSTEAFKKVCERIEIPFTDALFQDYRSISAIVWQKLERGEIEQKMLQKERFDVLFAHHDIDKDPEQANEVFLEEFVTRPYLEEGARGTIDSLSKKYELVIVSNGFSKSQYIRLEGAELLPYFQHIFISEEIGAAKPNHAFFEHVFETIGPHKASESLIIGDSLSSDITGGTNYGIDTCWYNPKDKENALQCIPNYKISHLNELHTFL